MSREKIEISVVIPCYNCERSIENIVFRIEETLTSKYAYEIILVNDGSHDNTWNKLSELAHNNEEVTAINFSKNFGQHSAIMAAYRESIGEFVVGLDDDGEHKPEDILALIEKISEGYDYVCADYQENRGTFRAIGTKMNNLMAQILIDKPRDLEISSLYIMRRYVVDEIVRYQGAYPYIAGLLLRTTQNLGTVKLDRNKRMFGSSGYTLKKLLHLWINGFTAFSVVPLRISTALGAIFSIISFIIGAVVLIAKLCGYEMLIGFPSMIICINFFSGLILMALGVTGEYIGRIYVCINNSPQYVIKEVIK